MSLDFKQPRIFWVCCSWGPVQTLHLLHSTLSAGQPCHCEAVQRQPHHLRHFQQGLEHVRQYFSGDGGGGGKGGGGLGQILNSVILDTFQKFLNFSLL